VGPLRRNSIGERIITLTLANGTHAGTVGLHGFAGALDGSDFVFV
jgi:hypothetical protein